ncbi:MAG TPA: hypothetical protein VNB24_09790 [Acidimicrobiales bacterium]|nr:hypothetical protein [Acidimicrobiales bacterium]
MIVTSLAVRLVTLAIVVAAVIFGVAFASTAAANPPGYCAYSHPVPPSPVEEIVVCTP